MNIQHRTTNAQHPRLPEETIGRSMAAILVGRASSRAGLAAASPRPDNRFCKSVTIGTDGCGSI
jgi:hypothetical protein